MFTLIEIENIGPYTDKVIYDFRVNTKDKKNIGSVLKLPDGNAVSKIIGIIAGNACGKTSFIDCLISIGAYISNPVIKRTAPSVDEMINNNRFRDAESRNVYEKYYEYLQTNTPLDDINKGNEDKPGKISVELFINSGNEQEGYYRYSLTYGFEFKIKGIIEEKLEFRNSYRNKYKTIFTVNNSRESEIGYKIAYKQNILQEWKNLNVDTTSLEEQLKYYETFYNRYLNESATLDYLVIEDEEDIANYIKEEPVIFKKALTTVDNSVKDVEVDDESKHKKVYIHYDGYKLRYDKLSTASKKMCEFISNYVITSKKGGVLLSDELDNTLNREVSKMLINIYINENIKRSGQLVFTTTTPEILEELRRDQIFILTKKNKKVSLIKFSDFIIPETNKHARNDFSFIKAYKNNIINNYPLANDVKNFITYLENR